MLSRKDSAQSAEGIAVNVIEKGVIVRIHRKSIDLVMLKKVSSMTYAV